MRKPAKTQWEFGELFASESYRKVLSVSELTGTIRRVLEGQVGQVWVTGEITNFRQQNSGHIYFTLKDAGSQISCVLFRGVSVSGRDALCDGQKVVLQGEVTVYEPRGQYQLMVRQVELQGVGALQVAFERLKQKLQAEGLFASERKRPLPRYPQTIGLVTSPTGAAIRDVIHVIRRRHPALRIILSPCRVQGTGASSEIALAIESLNEWSSRGASNKLDLILITRGGGSLEDLWAFNEEAVARAVFHSRVPVVSAVGHEIDFTIADFVADMRAATPSAAAEIITEGAFASRQFVSQVGARLLQRIRSRVGRGREDLIELARRLARSHPRRRLNEQLQRLDDLRETMHRLVAGRMREQRSAWGDLSRRWRRLRPGQAIARRRDLLAQCRHEMRDTARRQLLYLKARAETLEARLRLLSPMNVLERGYSITVDASSNSVIRSPADASPGQSIVTRLKSGEIRSVVEGGD